MFAVVVFAMGWDSSVKGWWFPRLRGLSRLGLLGDEKKKKKVGMSGIDFPKRGKHMGGTKHLTRTLDSTHACVCVLVSPLSLARLHMI